MLEPNSHPNPAYPCPTRRQYAAPDVTSSPPIRNDEYPRHHVSPSPRQRQSAAPNYPTLTHPTSMTNQQPSPYQLAHILRDFAQAKVDLHPIAADITTAGTLPAPEAAIWFANLKAGHLRCSFSPTPGQPPCTADANVAVSQQSTSPALITSTTSSVTGSRTTATSVHTPLSCGTTPSHCSPPNGTSVTLLTPHQIHTPKSVTSKVKSDVD